ncbi:ligase-associated DNA damage response DEXH box helicase [Microvirga tunisiensis]|uniref:Ligase-associated DNA damage response DEXH box helicase n=1 Tax=Microvirga tunisiensis TaxID=2108360 RepID=A0A5N7MEA7_9HYPH|nr:ligase-associated DNA damage response DEXH box helicase [Microvirga tunisiensis]MPR06992.1 ligase-associated DNA damage response DEXH box helicase [Microvirga tunisiensis]MPR25282.1 ligase-associated DNA damage response DEXH box helicase [Microvirga tunisiensis]
MSQVPASLLPKSFRDWFKRRGWAPRDHQLELLAKAGQGRSVLLVAPTGAGKTLAGFLPSLVELAERGGSRSKEKRGLHTLYISPLKALATDIARNLEAPVAEMDLPIRIETRTGDTPSHKRARQIERPPDILLTTPEQLALLLAHAEAREFFKDLRRVVLDELHSLVTSKRGDLLSLGLARLLTIAPQATAVGLSATVREPDDLRRYLVPQRTDADLADLVVVQGGAQPDIRMLELDERLPLAGHTASLSMPAIYDLIRDHKTTLVFVNTRLQAEYTFQELWKLNDDSLAIALHHGSLDVSQRRRVEEAMAAGKLKAVVCTATLDLGIDWGDVDLVVNVGAPKGASRIMQRIGRSNHRMDEPSEAYLVPANRFEILECRAALDAVHEAAQDTPDARIGALDVLCQHILGMACAEPFKLDELYEEVRSAAPYAGLGWEDFEACVAFVATGGYALRAYERFAKIVKGKNDLWRVRDAKIAQQYRLNVGTIVESSMIKVRLGRTARSRPGTVLPRGRILGEIEEYFAETLTPGDTFLFAGEVLRFEGISEDEVLATRAGSGADPMIPSYEGGKFPLSTFLAARVRAILADPFEWDRLPQQMTEWLLQQRRRSIVPGPRDLLVETFPRSNRFYMTCFPFEGRLAHQTLGMLLTRRLERAKLKPLGFVANDYGIAVYASGDIASRAGRDPHFMDELFSEDMLGDDLEDWLAESSLMKRTFRQCAVIAGLIERRFPGEKKTGRQVTISTDLVYDVLRKHEPDHVLLRAARADAATGLLDVRRLGMMLERIRGRIIHKPLDRVSPLSVSVMLEIGRERVYSDNADEILAEAEAALLDEALA